MNLIVPSVPGSNSETGDPIRADAVPDAAMDIDTRSAPGVFLMTNSFETGGSERQFVALAGALQPDHFRVTVGCLQPKGPLRGNLGPVLHFGLGGSLYGRQSIRTRFRLASHLRRSDISIAHAFDYYTNLTLIPAAKLARTPVVIGSLRQLGDLLTPAQWRTQLAMFRLADCVVCNSEAAADKLRQQGFSEDRLTVIGNGLSSASFVDRPRGAPQSSGVFRVGMIARMNTPSKNHRIMLEVAARLRPRLPKLEIVFLGDGPLRPDLQKRAAELGIREIVQFLGDRRDVAEVLSTLDVTVLPSSSESLSNAILESMAAGVPVIACGVGGNVELLSQDRGILVPPNDLSALEEALRKIADDPAPREASRRKAFFFAQENFTLERMRQKHEDLYLQLLKRKESKGRRANQGRERQKRPAPIRVSIVAASLRYVGGQSVQADLLRKHWEKDPDVRRTFIPIDPEFPRGLRWVEKVPVLRTIVRTPIYVWHLWRGLKEADVAHVFSASYWSFLLAPVPAWVVGRMRGTKILLHYHSGEARDHLRRSGAARIILRKIDLLIVPSGYLVDVFREFGLKAQAIPNIVDLGQLNFRERRPLRPHLLSTRGFHPYYRVDLVVRAFAEVKKTFPEAQLDLAGGGPLEAQISNLVATLKLTGVKFLGEVSRDQIGKAYDQADIFVNASSLDNMPVSILEAFASGMPVVSTCPEGMTYLVDHDRTGLLSPPGDAGALADHILRVLNEKDLGLKLAANAYEELNRYRWSVVREQWLGAYRALVSASPHSFENNQ